MPNLTKETWRGVRVALLAVPVKARTSAWKKAVALIDRILSGVNDLAMEFNLETMKYSVECQLCGKPISVDEDFVFKAVSGVYRHYDCFMTNDNGKIGESLK